MKEKGKCQNYYIPKEGYSALESAKSYCNANRDCRGIEDGGCIVNCFFEYQYYLCRGDPPVWNGLSSEIYSISVGIYLFFKLATGIWLIELLFTGSSDVYTKTGYFTLRIDTDITN